ncbi:L-serine ammonia-lyase, iron-sulfur-dependent subunit beta [Oscillibacter sp.]|uniref:L-serine ammonia-lyase, iron-sulfur-dependent subunit beta n=1 Tax=Oscillibacter sp. TaxID=1945593 RepID=UPI00289E3EC3|nr:L-serine ammonia-lyase, iron-sulfur-dependent subunit beta [Oscillibacter sp.]
MLDIFDILGPIMVGPSSSHTAGAVRIGNMARSLLGGEPKTANIGLHGSFAETGPGHGTDRALVAGLLGMRPDDLRIPRSFELAEKEGLEVSFRKVELKEAHPNTAVLSISDGNGRTLELQAASTGGGRIRVDALDGIHVNFTGIFNTLIIRSIDVPGKLAEVTWILEHGNVNIANMNLWRAKRGGSVLMVIETDEKVSPKVRTLIGELEDVTGVTYYEREDA